MLLGSRALNEETKGKLEERWHDFRLEVGASRSSLTRWTRIRAGPSPEKRLTAVRLSSDSIHTHIFTTFTRSHLRVYGLQARQAMQFFKSFSKAGQKELVFCYGQVNMKAFFDEVDEDSNGCISKAGWVLHCVTRLSFCMRTADMWPMSAFWIECMEL